jgi:hypothetical protein
MQQPAIVSRRLIYQIAGYDPVDAERHHRRFVRGIAVFSRTWGVSAGTSDLVKPNGGTPPYWNVRTSSASWRVESMFVPLVWSDIVLADGERSMPRRLVLFLRATFNFFRTGTAFRYFRARLTYGCFFLFPILHLLAYVGVGLSLGLLISGSVGFDGALYGMTAATISVAVFFILLSWLGRRFRVIQALDDWIFGWDFLHGRRKDVEARLDRFAAELVKEANGTGHDEIMVFGHSLGASLAISIIARALQRDPGLGSRVPVMLLTVGSTIQKFTLHPAADGLRRDAACVAGPNAVQWVDYQARADPISFYRVDPLDGSRVEFPQSHRKPIIRMVRIRNMLEPQTYRRIRFRFMRIHHQLVMANELRSPYDFYMMTCGPIPIDRVVATIEGLPAHLGPDGTPRETPSPARSDVANASLN